MSSWFSRFFNRTQRIILPDGRIAVIDHMKPDGNLAVRPIDPLTGAYLPNTSQHWNEEQRASIPEELEISAHLIRIAKTGRKPLTLKVRI